MQVTLLKYTDGGDELAMAAAGTCYDSYVGPGKLRTIIKSGHESVIEHVSFTFKIEGVSRALLAQLTRHRIASFCVSGDTVVGYDHKNKGVTIKELYRKKPQYIGMSKLRCVDEMTKEIVFNRVIQVFNNGEKETYTLETEDGYTVRATANHRFLTESGWKQLSELSVGENVYTNGVPAYQQREWLDYKYNNESLTQKEIAKMCGVSSHTVRNWVRKFGIQKPMGSWSIGKEPPNKGKTKDSYEPLKRSSESRKKYLDTHVIISPKKQYYELDQGYVATECAGRGRVAKLYPRKNVCAICKEKGKTEIHHIDRDPKNFTDSNLIELCIACHKRAHKGYSVKAVKPSKIKSITYFGKENVYDIEMESPYHNYIANGFVVHNCVQSQRYVDMGAMPVVVPESIKQNKEMLNEYGIALDAVKTFYKRAVQAGIPKEDARYILPNATQTTIVMTMNARELRHFFSLRCCNRAQWEIRAMADEMLKLCKEKCPVIFADAGPGCVNDICHEERPCGNPRTFDELFDRANNPLKQ